MDFIGLNRSPTVPGKSEFSSKRTKPWTFPIVKFYPKGSVYIVFPSLSCEVR